MPKVQHTAFLSPLFTRRQHLQRNNRATSPTISQSLRSWLLIACLASCKLRTGENGGATGAHESEQKRFVDTIKLTRRSDIPVRFKLPGGLPPDFEARVLSNDLLDSPGLGSADDVGVPYRGGFAIADGTQILVVDSSHRIVERIGRRGQGPGEFEFTDAVCVSRGDTLVVIDGSVVTNIFDEHGKFVQRLRLQPSNPASKGCFGDGTLLTYRPVAADSLKLERYSLGGRFLNVIATVPYDFSMGGAEIVAPFSVIAKDTLVYWANPWIPEILVFTVSGDLRRLYKLDEVRKNRPRTGTPNLFAVPKAGGPTFAPALGKSSTWPYFWHVMVSEDDVLWIQEHPQASGLNLQTWEWTGFASADGKPVGKLLADSTSVEEGAVRIVGFRSSGVSVRFEAKSGQAEYRTISWSSIGKN